MSDQQKGWNL